MEHNPIERAKAWATNDYFDESSRKEVQTLLDNNDEKEITERFYKDLEFGTGGIRSIIGQGTNRINTYTVRKATQALSNEVIRSGKEEGLKEFKVAISYDSRKFSFEFAKEVASVFAGNGIHAYIYKRLNPVPLLSFSVRHHKAQAGVMVTASHNPPEYNGYKVFWNDGAQVTPPNDMNIINNFLSISDFSTINTMDFEEGVSKGLIHWVGEDVENAYYDAIGSKTVRPQMCQEKGDKLNIVYTPIHGTGYLPCTTALKNIGFSNVQVVEEQKLPNQDFPTVSSPNPENPEALALAVKLMEDTGADIAMGTDPDTDRVGLAFKHDGEMVYLNGNQIGIVMLHYMLKSLQEQATMPSNPYFVKTIVTTPLQDVIAQSFGVEVENTLTGFKWICGKMNQIEKTNPERNFVFATEESFGYLNHEYVRDKDGVSSITLLSEICLYYKLKGMDLVDALDKIYEEYGFSHETLLNINYYGKEGSEKIARIMEDFRTYDEKTLCGDEISYLEDFKTQKSKNFTDLTTTKLDLPSSNVLGFNFKNGTKVYMRPSGTEPKIKFYIMIQETEGTLDEKKARALAKTEEFLTFIKARVEKA
ncbi:phospho-sugar mutase [Halobacteriovorax sp. HLS]|uniref:phospho-sugar mutase n=1 Tax=Halobacteriovorax sp. HLS TaxID=2234000 RepID=UPI000FD96538|nr:phospho-sugar mutase [Halobacteriovorax sp. HLS]